MSEARKETAAKRRPEEAAARKKARPKPDEAPSAKKKARPKPDEAPSAKKRARPKSDEAPSAKKRARPKPDEASSVKKKAKPKPDEAPSEKKKARPKSDEASAEKQKPRLKPEPESAPKRRARSRSGEASPKREISAPKRRDSDLFMERSVKPEKPKKSAGSPPPKQGRALFTALNACLAIGIAVLVALAVRQQAQYETFKQMRDVVDQQTFYEGTTVEGVDVSKMTLSNAMDYWRDRVEPRYAGRAATLDDGETVTAGELGYTSDYASVLSAAWSAGRSGTLEQRYRMATVRRENPVAYSVTRVDFSDALVDQYVQDVAQRTDRPAVDASIASFDAESYEFVFNPAETGQKLDTEALKRDIEQAIRAGGGNVVRALEQLEPQVTQDEVESSYGLIDYAITNASSSSKARLNNIKLAMSMINGTRIAPGETFSFNEAVGERTTARGFRRATAYSGGDVTEQVGGGICQVSTTLFNAAVKADMEIVERHNHSLTVSYVDKGKDATVDWGHQDFRFKNTSPDDVYICCYLTDDKRVRFGIFGRLLPNGETITLEAVTTEMVKYETEYQPSPLLAKGEMVVSEKGRNGYRAEAYKIRWDAEGNRLSRELLCKSYYKVKNEIVQYGA